MNQPDGHYLAELNIGRLLAPTDDPQVKDFMDNLDLINGLGKRMPGFVWMMEGSGEPGRGNTDLKLEGDPQFVSNLSIWETPADLETFVWGTLHKKFYDRKAEWFEVMDKMHFVMWWIKKDHRPDINEALARLEYLEENGDSEHAFGWKFLKDAELWKTHGCTTVAAE